MRDPAIMFRLPGPVLPNLDALAKRLNVSVNLIAKMIVIREIMNIPAMLEEHDKQLADIHEFLRDIAIQHHEYLSENSDEPNAEADGILKRLDEVMSAVDSIRSSAFVRPSTYIEDLIRQHDERPVQESLGV